MADGIFERGEVYWVMLGSGYPGEKGVARPAVIVSCDEANRWSSCVTVAFLTTKSHGKQWEVFTDITGKDSWVMCHELMTYDKQRFGKCFGKLNSAEMYAVDSGLEYVMDLGYADEVALKEKDREIEARDAVIAKKDAEIVAVKAAAAELVEKAKSVDLSHKAEIAMWQKLYEKALDQLVDMKLTGDIQRKVEKLVPVAPVVPVSPVAAPVVEEPVKKIDERVDINRCTITALKKLGFSLAVAKKIVAGRPYNAVSDLKNGFGIKATHYRIMEPKLKCAPIIKSALAEPEPGYEVEEPVIVPEEPVAKKVNINTASALEIHEKLGLSKTVCYSITGCRKRDGLYKSVQDLLNVPKFTAHHMEKYGHLLEV